MNELITKLFLKIKVWKTIMKSNKEMQQQKMEKSQNNVQLLKSSANLF